MAAQGATLKNRSGSGSPPGLEPSATHQTSVSTTSGSTYPNSSSATLSANQPAPGTLFDVPAMGLQEEREENRRTITERCEAAVAALEGADTAVAWCHLNDESALLAKLIPGAVEVAGSDSPEVKEERLAAFSRGQSDASSPNPLGAWGLNWQHCSRMTYFPPPI